MTKMNFFSTFVLFAVVTYSNGLPAVPRSSSLNLPSCPANSIVLERFRALHPCAVYCFVDRDCGADGLVCCATGCSYRCVAETILERTGEFQGDDESFDDVIPEDLDASGIKDTKFDEELDILADMLSEARNEEKQKENTEESKEDETKEEVVEEEEKEEEEEEEEEEEVEEEEEEEEREDEEDGQMDVKVEEDEDVEEEENNLTTQGPETESEATTLEGDESLEEDEEEAEEEEEVPEEEEWDDEEEDNEIDSYSVEEDGEEDLEMLLMELLYNLKAKKNSRHSPWNEESHSSRSLLQRNEPNKFPGRRADDFMENAMPPPNALEASALNEETRELDDKLGGYFIDRAFKMDELKNQEEVQGRRSSMEKRDEGFVNEERKNKNVINRSNIMRR